MNILPIHIGPLEVSASDSNSPVLYGIGQARWIVRWWSDCCLGNSQQEHFGGPPVSTGRTP